MEAGLQLPNVAVSLHNNTLATKAQNVHGCRLLESAAIGVVAGNGTRHTDCSQSINQIIAVSMVVHVHDM